MLQIFIIEKVVDYLREDTTATAYLERLAADESFYNPFNMVLLEPEQTGPDGNTLNI